MVRFVLFLRIFYFVALVKSRSLFHNSEDYDTDAFTFGNFKHKEEKNNFKRETDKKLTKEIGQILKNVTEKINHQEQQYMASMYRTLFPKMDRIIYEYKPPQVTKKKTTVTAAEEDFLGTAQIEALLNDIKARAMEMVAEQSPSVTDMITNTVTEATFEADPILTHLDVSSPRYALSTIVFLRNIENIDKRTANNSNTVFISEKGMKHNISSRSMKEDAVTVARNVEDMLQKELKNIYEKVKNKVSCEMKAKEKKNRSTLKAKSTTSEYKETTMLIKTTKSSKHKQRTRTKPRHSREHKHSKKIKTTALPLQSTTAATEDDFAMLTLYEQILAKTHEDNVMKFLTTNNKRKIDETIKLSPRNPETLTDLSLKEDMKRIYEDGENMPDVVYSKDANTQPSYDFTHSDNNSATSNFLIDTLTTDAPPLEDTSYEALSDKIAFKDYVNGYKNYLNFQKEQAKQNFSNLVKYQAHKHHKVDDIGKFILNKIPQIPQRKKRFFFDDTDLDDQDLSTKSDDSWFKKHFYMFIDKNPPKKYHSSETVAFKAGNELYKESYNAADMSMVDKNGKEVTPDINLDELSKALEGCKATAVGLQWNIQNDFQSTKDYNNEKNGFGIFFRSQYPQSKRNDEDPSENRNDDNFLFVDRYRRNVKQKGKAKNEMIAIKTQTSMLNKQDKVKSESNNDDAYATISPLPTAVVNLRKNKVKGNKLKKLLMKLHLHKNKKKLKQKRQCTRVQRFNPLKKIKILFGSRNQAPVLASSDNLDYDMMNSHIDTFKPIKYDKVPSIDELRQQVPNISSNIIIKEDQKIVDFPEPNRWQSNDFDNLENQMTVTKSSSSTTNPSSIMLYNTTYNSPKMTHKSMPEDFLMSDNIMNVKIKTLPRLDSFNKPSVAPESLMNEVDRLLLQSTQNDMRLKTLKTHADNNNDMRQRIFDSINQVKDKDSAHADSYTIHGKLTRIAKFPLSHLTNVKGNTEIIPIADNSKLYEFAEDDSYLNVHDESYSNPATKEAHPNLSQINEVNPNNVNKLKYTPFSLSKQSYDANKYTTDSDYFNDLVIWNSDILDEDQLTNQPWKEILKNVQHDQDFSTPNIREMQKEVLEINENIAKNELSHIHNNQIKKPVTKLQKPNLKDDFVSKPEGIQIELKNNHPNELQGFGNGYHKTNKILHNRPKTYVPFQSQDIIDVLDKIYTENPHRTNARAFGNSKTNEERNYFDQPIIDKTSSFYKDNIVTESIVPKKTVKGSVTLPSSKNKVHIIPKINKPPKQNYNTPLPMKNEKFQKFLFDNQLDVETVTAPMVEMPTITETWHSQLAPLAKSVQCKTMKDDENPLNSMAEDIKTQKKTTRRLKSNLGEMVDNSYPENEIEYLSDLENYLMEDYNDNNVYTRRKRSSLHDYGDFTRDGIFGNFKLENRANIDTIGRETTTTDIMKMNSKDYSNDNNFEFTIIDFDDKNKNIGNDKLVTDPYLQLTSIKTDSTKSISANSTKVLTTKNQQTLTNITNNKLVNQNNDIEGELESNAQASSTEPLGDMITPMNFMEIPKKSSGNDKNKSKNESLPKSVLISSYKYDILFNVPSNKYKTSEKNSMDITTPIDDSTYFKMDMNAENRKENNDTFSNEDGVTDDNYKTRQRAGRGAKTTKKRLTHSQTLYLAREMKSARNNRLSKLLPSVREKLRTKNKFTTVASGKAKGAKKREALKPFNVKEINDKDINISEANNVQAFADVSHNPIYGFPTVANSALKDKLDSINHEERSHAYNDRVYYGASTESTKSVNKPKLTEKGFESDKSFETNHNKPKRDAKYNTFTAKDVAALEIIVDLMKNNYDVNQTDTLDGSSNNYFTSLSPSPLKSTDEKITNSIQVHIAIPYNLQDKKRSVDPVRLRKVFTAKMATPVDLEYQIHSIEDNSMTTVSSDSDYSLSPGMYLLVDNVNGFTLKPVQVRNIEDVTTKVEENKSDKVVLSKELIAAVNEHLSELFQNITTKEKEKRHGIAKRGINWDTFRKYLGHDRVCDCKCKANKTMCRACAASDAVIKELSFEFNNLAQYMNEHCTEIQTFFWMNPSSGKRLRDTVHKIDKSLNDYFKRVRGKCLGRTCKTFNTYIDKRNFRYDKNVLRNNVSEALIENLKSLHNDLYIASNFIPYDYALKEKGDELVKTAFDCIGPKSIGRRSIDNNPENKQKHNSMYSLDNISVNIICNPNTSSDSENTSPIILIDSTHSESKNIILDYDLNKRNSKKGKSLKQILFGHKNKFNRLFTYDVIPTVLDKRETHFDQIESPLLADTGGSFWHDYLSKGSINMNKENMKPKLEILVVQTNTQKTPTTTRASIKHSKVLKNTWGKEKIQKLTPIRNNLQTFDPTTENLLTNNINILFKLMGTMKDPQKITFTEHIITTRKPYTTKLKMEKHTTKKHTKLHKGTKTKMHHKHGTKTTNAQKHNSANKNMTKGESYFKQAKSSKSPKTSTVISSSMPVSPIDDNAQTLDMDWTKYIKATPKPKSKMDMLDKIKMATIGFISNLKKEYQAMRPSNTAAGKPTTNYNIEDKTLSIIDMQSDDADLKENVISGAIVTTIPTILIINTQNGMEEESKAKKYGNILLSLLKYKSGSSTKEKRSLNEDNFENTKLDVRLDQQNSTSTGYDQNERSKIQEVETTSASSWEKDYDLIRDLKLPKIELPMPFPAGTKPEGEFEKTGQKTGETTEPQMAVPPPGKETDSMVQELKTYHQWNRKPQPKRKIFRRLRLEEADPTKTHSKDVLYISGGKRPSRYHKLRNEGRNYTKYGRNEKIDRKPVNYHTEVNNLVVNMSRAKNKLSIDVISQDYDGNHFVRTEELRHRYRLNKPEFDSYFRVDHGIYRLKRNRRNTGQEDNIRVRGGIRGNTDDKINDLENDKSQRNVLNEISYGLNISDANDTRKMARESRKTKSMWMDQVIAGYILKTVFIIYVAFAISAAAFIWAYRK